MPTILGYGTAVLSVAIANGLAFFVLRYFEAILTPFLFAVAATVWYAGTGPGVLAIVLSVLSLNHFFLRPDFSFGPISYADLVYLAFCIFCALAVAWVSAVRRRTEQELRQARDELEAKVLERTANLQRSESYLAETQKLTHTGSWAWDARSQKVLYCSEEMFRIYGLDPQVDLPTRKNFRQRVHPEDRNRTDERFVRVVNEKVDSFDEYRVLLPDGTIKHVNSSGHPVLDENGEFIAFIGTATDVTERKRAEEALRESEAKIRRLVDSNIIGIFITGLEGRVLEANDAFLHLVGHDRDDLVSGRVRWTDLTPPEWRERDRRALGELSSNTITRPYEKEFFRKDGSRVPVLIGGALFEEGGNEGVAFVLDLTERKRAEESLRESERSARSALDGIAGLVAIMTPNGEVETVNRQCVEYFGRPVEEQKDWVTTDMVHPEDLPQMLENFKSAIASEIPYHFEQRLRRFDGKYRWFETRGGSVRDDTGSIVRWYVLLTDIEDRKRAEQALRRSEAHLAEAERLSHTGAVAYNGTAILFASEETYRIWGFDPAQGLPSRDVVFQRIHPGDRDRLTEEVRREVGEKRRYSIGYRIVLPDGTVKHLETIGQPVFSASGELVEIFATQTDVTERKRAEEALRESEAKIRRLVDSNIIGIFIWDFDGRILEANDEFLRMVSYDREELVSGRIRWAELTPPDWRDRNNARIEQQKGGGRFEPFEKEYTRKDGRRVPVLIGGATFEQGGNQGVAYVLDLTVRKRVEAEAREIEQRYRTAQLELAHANRVATMGQLTASITHEVNQPITAAVTYASAARRLLSAEPPDLHEVDDVLSLIVKEGNRAGEVVGRIRALIKKAPARKDAVAINDAILEVIALTRTEAANNSVSVRTQLAEGLPHVEGDRVQLQQVLLNLMINAIEAMRDVGEEERELLISTRNEPDGVSVEVRDSGPGFAPTDIDRVFEAFYSTKPSGVGLGLSICRSIIEAHNGRLSASPNVPRGAIFRFTAPAHPAAES